MVKNVLRRAAATPRDVQLDIIDKWTQHFIINKINNIWFI